MTGYFPDMIEKLGLALRGRENFEARYSKAARISCRLASGVRTRPILSCLRISPADNNDAVNVISSRLRHFHDLLNVVLGNAYG